MTALPEGTSENAIPGVFRGVLNSCAFILFLPLFCSGATLSAELDCRPLQVRDVPYSGPQEFGQGLLWQVSKPGLPVSHVFGTIHVAERHVSAQLDQVRGVLTGSEAFVMEFVFDPEGMEALRGMMFFEGDTRLGEVISADLYARTLAILQPYHLNERDIAVMKPWAAYLTMSYPADMGVILDQRLLQLAASANVSAGGLETLEEQGQLFDSFSHADQVRLLTDAVCHRELMVGDFAAMIALYTAGDLAGLSAYGQRYSFEDNTLYETLTDKLLTRRNRLMVDRMQAVLAGGKAFIAVGALHLPGEEGVLALLRRRGFDITPVF